MIIIYIFNIHRIQIQSDWYHEHEFMKQTIIFINKWIFYVLEVLHMYEDFPKNFVCKFFS